MKILKSVLPMATLLLAVFGAFAFNQAPKDSSMNIDMIGVVPGSCEESSTVCSTIFDLQKCQESGQWLYRLNAAGTACPEPLYRKH